MKWTEEETNKLVELYIEHECIWNILSVNYKNKNLRNAAYADIVNRLNKNVSLNIHYRVLIWNLRNKKEKSYQITFKITNKTMNTEIKRRKRVSKKKKGSWRKVDNSDVDKFLDIKRLKERTGEHFDKCEDGDLFEVDFVSKKKNSGLTTKKEQLKCLKGLENTSAVPDPVKKRNRVRTKEERQNPILKKKTEERIKKGLLKKKDRTKLEKLFIKKLRNFNQKPKWRVEINKDVWNENSDNKINKLQNWFSKETMLHNVRNTRGIKEASDYQTAKCAKKIDSFEIPHPGISYNPTFKDHSNLLHEVVEKEFSNAKKEQHLDRVTNKLFSQVTEAERQKMWLKEMSEGLPVTNVLMNESSKSDDAKVDTNTEYSAVNPPVTREKKKTRKQKNKELRLKKEEMNRNQLKLERQKNLDICRLKRITAEVEQEKLLEEEKKQKRLKKREQKSYEPGRVGKHKFNATDDDFALTTDLCESLRNVVPQGSILKDKFLNMQKRNLIEVMKPQFKKRKAKSKKYTVNSHRINPVEFSANDVLKKFRKLK